MIAVLAVIGKILLILLKVILWTVVGILGLLLLILLIVFFLPIRYRIQADGGKTAQGTDVDAHVCVHLLLRLIQADITFKEKKLEGWLRIAWIRKQLIGGSKKEPEAEPAGQESSEPEAAQAILEEPEEEETIIVEPAEEPAEAEPAPEPEEPSIAEPEQEPEPEPISAQEEPEPEPVQAEEEPAPAEEEPAEEKKPVSEYDYIFYYGEAAKEVRLDQLPPVFDKIEQKLTQITEKISGISSKAAAATQKLSETLFKFEKLWYEIVYYPDRPYIQSLLIRKLKKIGRNIRPTHFQLTGRYGFDSPVTTANITSVYGLMAGWTGRIRHYAVDLTPDFENEMFVGSLDTKGRLQGYMVLFPLLRIAISRRVWKLVKYISRRRKKETNHGN